MGWPDEATERLKTLWANKRSIGEIAKLFDCTRSKIAGKLHRLGLIDSDRAGDTAAVRRRANRVKAAHRMAVRAKRGK